ncbi:MAG: redoxin family protein [Tepidisphaeraceae bacterium]|jgi:peroxiredoxin
MKSALKLLFAACFGLLTAGAAPAVVSPDAQKLLDQIRQAYASVKTLTVSGTVGGHLDIDGQTADPNGQFAGLYDHGKFRNEVKDDAIVGNTGATLYLYLPADHRYLLRSLSTDSDRLELMDPDIADVVRKQDPSLALALAADAAAELIDGATAVERAQNVTVDGASLPALKITRPDCDIVIIVDDSTHLLRRQTVDVTKQALLRGAHTVKSALITFDMTEQPGQAIDPARFAFSPPPGAQALQLTVGEGSQAPSFSLTGLDGSQVSSSDLHGSVYVLDFWATWCPPCIASLPKLDDLHQSMKDTGLKVFAINEQEDKDTIQKFMDSKKLTLPVLMDADGSTLQAYGSDSIPHLVIVGKDGKILKVHEGVADEDAIRREVQDALAAK